MLARMLRASCIESLPILLFIATAVTILVHDVDQSSGKVQTNTAQLSSNESENHYDLLVKASTARKAIDIAKADFKFQ